MKKKVLSVLLILALVITCFTGCGDKDTDKKKKKSENYDDVYELIGSLGDLEKGNVSVAFDFDLGSEGVVKMTMNSKRDGKGGCALGISFDADVEETKMSGDLEDLVVVKSDMAYINLAAIVDFVANVANVAAPNQVDVKEFLGDTKLGYFAIPLPDIDDSVIEKFTDNSIESFVKFLEDAFEDSKVEGEDNEFSIAFEDVDSYKTLFNAMADYLEAESDNLVKRGTSFSADDFDLDAYAKKLIDYYYDDAVELASAFGIEKAQIDAVVDQVKEMDLNAELKKAMEDPSADIPTEDELKEELESMISDVRSLADEISEEEIEDFDASCTVKYDDGGYKFKGAIEGKGEDSDKKISFTIKIDEEDCKVSAPSDITKLGDFKDIVETLAPLLNGMGDDDLDYYEY